MSIVCLLVTNRYSQYRKMRALIDQNEGGLELFSRGYENFGFHRRLAFFSFSALRHVI